MDKLFEILKEFNIDNIGMLIFISVVIMSTAASYIQLLHASQFEAIFMSKNEESKRFFFMYAIIYFFFVVVNYLFTINSAFFVLNFGLLVLTLLVSSVLELLKKRGKAENVYWWVDERKGLVTLMTSTAVCIYVASTLFNINRLSCVIIGSLVEVLGLAVVFLNTGNICSSITVTVEGETWYVLKRIDEKYLLCGDNCRIDDSKKTKLIEIDNIVENNICFEKLG